MSDDPQLILPAIEALLAGLPRSTFAGLRKATVINDFDTVDDVLVTIDGDSGPSHIMSLAGELQRDQRVMCMDIEPHGTYIAWLLTPPAWRSMPFSAGWHQLQPIAPVTPQLCQIRRVGDFVQMRGMGCALSASPPIRILTIPPGFLTTKEQSFPADAGGAHASLVVGATTAGLDTALAYNGGGFPDSFVSIATVCYSVS